MVITAGIDLGSTYAKIVILRDGVNLGFAVLPTGHDHDETSKRGLDLALKAAKLERKDIEYIVSTGYGRNITTLANESISEISANAWGTRHIALKYGIRTIVDIGGQDTKVIALDDNLNVADFRMNDKCAAGTGRFLEMLAHKLELAYEQFVAEALKSDTMIQMNATCAVFAESEVVGLLARKVSKADIAAAAHNAIAARIASMVRRVGTKGSYCFVGGGPGMGR